MTQTEQQAISTSVDILADQALACYQQYQQQEKQHQQEQTDRQDKQSIAVLQLLLKTEIEADLLKVLAPSYEVHRDSYGSPQTEAKFIYAGVTWHLVQDFSNRSHEHWRWSIRATTHDHWYASSLSNLATHATPLTLQTTLLLKLGERRQQMQTQQREAMEQERTRQQKEAQATAEQEQEAREREERIIQADQEHMKRQQQLEALKSQELTRMWHWPADVRIAIYQIAYTTGAGYGNEGETMIEQEHGWTGTDHLDHEGYIRLEPERSCYGSICEPREIKLDTARHMPTWQRMLVGSPDELPKTLREEIRVWIPNVYLQHDYNYLDGKGRLTYIEDGRYIENSPYSELIGLQPLPWVRALVERAIQQAHTPSREDQQYVVDGGSHAL